MQYLVEPPRHPMRSLLCYEELIKKGDFQGTGNEVEVYLWEVWTDSGEDGHIGYEHRGYVLSTLEPEGECYPVDIFLPWNWPKEDLVF